MSMLDDVQEFHRKFGMPTRRPGELFNREVILFRLSFVLEELHELSNSLNNNDLEGATDALVDLVWVSIGSADILGLPFEAAWAEVKKANMAKVKVATTRDSKRGSLLDIGKPPGWKPPDILQHLAPEDLTVQLALHTRSTGEA